MSRLPHDVRQNYITLERSRWSAWLGIAGGAVILGTLISSRLPLEYQPSKDWYKLALLGAVALCGGSAYIARKTTREYEYICNDVSDISDAQRQNNLYSLMALPKEETAYLLPSADVPTSETLAPTLFNWEVFNTKPDDYPHIMLIGGSGDGKTVTAEWLASFLGGTTFAVAPHKKPSDFPGIKTIRGKNKSYDPQRMKGGIYGTITDDIPSFSSILKGGQPNCTSASFFMSLYDEMQSRLDRLELGGDPGEFLNIIVDEANAQLEELGDIVERYIVPLIREARKCKIRLILLVQDDGVKALKLEGRSSVRKSLKYIYLKSFVWASKGSRGMANKLGLSPEEQTWMKEIEATQHIAIVEDTVAVIPNYVRPMNTNPQHEETLRNLELAKENNTKLMAEINAIQEKLNTHKKIVRKLADTVMFERGYTVSALAKHVGGNYQAVKNILSEALNLPDELE